METAMIRYRPQWRLRPQAQFSVNPDQTVTFKDPIGDVLLPAGYISLLQKTDGFLAGGDDNWFVTGYQTGTKSLALMGFFGFFSVVSGTSQYQRSPYHDGYLVPKGYIGIGECEGDTYLTDLLICCIPGHPDYGRVLTWMRSQFPWMTGENTRGFGVAANNITDFLNNLTLRQKLSHT
jgi:hypothetical protein